MLTVGVKFENMTIDWDSADRITVLNLKHYSKNLQEDLDNATKGKWLHPDDMVHHRAMIQAIDFVIKDFNGSE